MKSSHSMFWAQVEQRIIVSGDGDFMGANRRVEVILLSLPIAPKVGINEKPIIASFSQRNLSRWMGYS